MSQPYNPSTSTLLKPKSPIFDCFSDDSDDDDLHPVPAPPANPKCLPKLVQQSLLCPVNKVNKEQQNAAPPHIPSPTPTYYPVVVSQKISKYQAYCTQTGKQYDGIGVKIQENAAAAPQIQEQTKKKVSKLFDDEDDDFIICNNKVIKIDASPNQLPIPITPPAGLIAEKIVPVPKKPLFGGSSSQQQQPHLWTKTMKNNPNPNAVPKKKPLFDDEYDQYQF